MVEIRIDPFGSGPVKAEVTALQWQCENELIEDLLDAETEAWQLGVMSYVFYPDLAIAEHICQLYDGEITRKELTERYDEHGVVY